MAVDLLGFAQSQQPILSGVVLPGIQNIVQNQRAKKAEEAWQTGLSTFQADMTPENMMNLQKINPKKFEQFEKSWSTMQELERTQTVQRNSEIMGLLASGNTENALQMVQETAEAYRNSGDMNDATAWDSFAKQMADGDTDSVYGFLMAVNSATPEGQKANEALHAINQEKREEMDSEAGRLKIANELDFASEEDRKRALQESEGLGWETAQELIKLSSVRSMGGGSGGMTSNQFYNAESALRKEHQSAVSAYTTVGQSASKVRALAGQGTGFGDQGMIMLFNKVLDPPSVVRESEAAMTASNRGLVEAGRGLLKKLQEGERLTGDQRGQLLAAVDVMSDLSANAMKAREELTRNVIEGYGFAPERVLLNEGEGAAGGLKTEEPAATTPEATSIAIPENNFSTETGVGMTLGELKQRIVESNSWLKDNDREMQALVAGDEEYIRNRFKTGYGAAKSAYDTSTTEKDW